LSDGRAVVTIQELKERLGGLLVEESRLGRQPGVATGWSALDEFVIWGGLPKGALTLFVGTDGLGATSLWAQTAAQVTREKRWGAWVQGSGARLCPWTLRKLGVDLQNLVIVDLPTGDDRWGWVLEELLSLSLFDLIGFDLGDRQLKYHQLKKLRAAAKRGACALTLLSSVYRSAWQPAFSLVLEFGRNQVRLTRALHRPTPHLLPRRDTYADLMPQLSQSREASNGGDFSHV
jgi:hypothetical protein